MCFCVDHICLCLISALHVDVVKAGDMISALHVDVVKADEVL